MEPVLFEEFTQVKLIYVILSFFTIFKLVRACQVINNILEVLSDCKLMVKGSHT